MKNYFIIIIAALALTSCKKWLDVQPQSDIPGSEVFKTEEGFQESLNGIYTRCGMGDIYGGELSFGLPEVLAQNYSFTTNNSYDYRETAKYNYKDRDFMSKKDGIWKGLYSGIVNANLILESVDAKKDLFTGNNYALVKAEALALRAYLHFDVFRLFGSYGAGGDPVGIPYVTTYSKTVTPISPAEEALNKMLTDLNMAKDLLKDADSIRSPKYIVNYPDSSTEMSSKVLFNQNRRHRLNYYAVCGTLARVYLYKGDKGNALLNAEEVINSDKFPWTQAPDFNHTDPRLKDRILYKELVFGWYIPQRQQALLELFERNTSSLHVDDVSLNGIYDINGVGGTDRRYRNWFDFTNSSAITLTKYKRNPNAREDDITADRHPLMAPAIRLSEMYYIAAECTYPTNPTLAHQYLNKVRTERNIGTPVAALTQEEFMGELVKEMRKELYGEGQLFYAYKRLNRAIQGLQGAVITPRRAIFILPIPNDEIEFGGR